jgi:predicted Zn-dependent protease
VYDRLLQLARTGTEVEPIAVLAATDLDLGRGLRGAAADRLARLPPSLAEVTATRIARAAVAEAEGSPERAERWLKSALAAEPASIEALSRLVDLLLKNRRAQEAAQVATDMARRFPASPERQALVGETALAERRYGQAARAFEAALRLAPDAGSVRVELAHAELLGNHADAALAALRDADRSRDAEIIRGAAFSQQGHWTAAVQAYTRALATEPPTVELLNALGNAQIEAGQPAEAVATLERSLSLKAEQPEIRALLARARGRNRRSP